MFKNEFNDNENSIEDCILPDDCIRVEEDEPCIKIWDLEPLKDEGTENLRFVEPSACVFAQSINLNFPDLKFTDVYLDDTEADKYDDGDSETKDIEIEQSLHLIGVYQLSSFMGNTGTGELLNTFHLLPGEESTITISTFSKISTENTETSSIVDSYSSSTEEEFFTEVRNQETTLSYREETSAASGSVSGGLKGLISSVVVGVDASTDYGKTIHKEQTNFQDMFSRTLTQQTNRASSSRTIQVGTSTTTAQTNEKFESVQRVIKNPNISKTLNYQFKQAIQEYECVLHLIDMKIGYKHKKKGKMIVLDNYPLEKLDNLLERRIAPHYIETIKKRILQRLLFINAFSEKTLDMLKIKSNETTSTSDTKCSLDTSHPLDLKKTCIYDIVTVDKDGNETVKPGPYDAHTPIQPEEFIRFNRKINTSFEYRSSIKPFVPPCVSGFIVRASTQRLRTDSVVIEPKVGTIDALDENGQNLEKQKVWSKYLENRKELALIRREQLAQDILKRYRGAIENHDADDAWKVRFEAHVFNKLYFNQHTDLAPYGLSED